MRVLLTGGHGMVGRNFCAQPLDSDTEIHAPTRAELDLRDKPAVVRAIRRCAPDLIVHAAGKVGGIQANMSDPLGFFLENLEIGTNVVAAAIESQVPRLINLASSCIYPRNVDGLLSEDMILKGELEPTNEGYALAKLAALKLCQYAAAAERNLNYKTIIPCNLYGRWDNFDLASAHLIPAIIAKIHRAKTHGLDHVEIWGDGRARREFMYAGDLAEALLQVIQRFDSTPSLMNVGLGYDHTIADYYGAVAKVIGWDGGFTYDTEKPTGMQRKVVDIARQNAWGWKPRTSLHDGIAATYEYFLRKSHP